MDQEELALREREHRLQRRSTWLTASIALVSAMISVGALATSIRTSGRQSQESAAQFDRTIREGRFTDIVSGLASSSTGVQVNSMRMLVKYVKDDSNYTSAAHQREAAVDAVQTLAAFIEDESTVSGKRGLNDYQLPQPIVVSRALGQLRALMEGEEWGPITVDLSRGNFHGAYVTDFRPTGDLYAPASDFRRANLTRLDVRNGTANFVAAHLTCAVLVKANLGRAQMHLADLSGADLSGADLSEVEGLEAAQLSGATTSGSTRLPRGVAAAPLPAWGAGSSRCRHIVNVSTGLRAGAGYSKDVPCPPGLPQNGSVLSRPEARALSQVCDLRRPDYVAP